MLPFSVNNFRQKCLTLEVLLEENVRRKSWNSVKSWNNITPLSLTSSRQVAKCNYLKSTIGG